MLHHSSCRFATSWLNDQRNVHIAVTEYLLLKAPLKVYILATRDYGHQVFIKNIRNGNTCFDFISLQKP